MAQNKYLFSLHLTLISLVATGYGKSGADSSGETNRAERQIYGNWALNPFHYYSPPAYAVSPYYDDYDFPGNSILESPHNTAQLRLNGLGINAINNIFFNNRLLSLDSCTGTSDQSGVCATRAVCSIFSGTSSGSCSLGRVCCINTVSTCEKTITVNNTYWQAPNSLSAPSDCSLTIKLDSRLIEQSKTICQVRLDFTEFTTAQPSATQGESRGVCDVDTFKVTGATNNVPTICGDNGGQHMYLTVPNSGTSPSNVKLQFKFGSSSSTTRSWKIKIGLLPCSADYLAPDGCLQYFTTSSGVITSFNFKDTTPASRKLANQEYGICFRTEVVNGEKANQMCLDECTVTGGNHAFRISGDGDVSQQIDPIDGFCQNDFLVFVGGTNTNGLSLDRLCGGALNTESIADKSTICSKMTPFKITFKTDGTERDVDVLNTGFCLNFSQKVTTS